MTYHDPARIPVQDPDVRKALEEIRRSLVDLARDLRFVDVNVTLPNATAVLVQHGLGRPHLAYSMTAPKGATATGRIVESLPTDTSITLTATGFGATVTVRVRFW